MSLANLAVNIREQDKQRPNHPVLFCLYEVNLVAVGDTDRINDMDWEDAWFDHGEGELIENHEDMFDALEIFAEGEDEVTVNNDEYTRLKMLRVPKLVSVFFTQQAAQQFIDERRHAYREPYIESIRIDGNAEMQEVRQLITNTF